ncbi:MAG: HPr family phosphocarrier protein [Thermaurantiacus sp.]
MAGPQRLRIVNARGLHARASARFVTVASRFEASVSVTKDGHAVTGTSIMGLMMLAAAMGDEIEVAAMGNDAPEALAALSDLVESGFGEER